MKRGTIITISGLSGTGKTAIARELSKKIGTDVSMTYTTRAPRAGEVDGKDYIFVSEEEFNELDFGGFMIESDKNFGNMYGTPRKILDLVDEGKIVVLVITMAGVEKIREIYPNVFSVFLLPPSIKEGVDRLISRGTESISDISSRVQGINKQLLLLKYADYIVVNETIKEATDKIIKKLRE